MNTLGVLRVIQMRPIRDSASCDSTKPSLTLANGLLELPISLDDDVASCTTGKSLYTMETLVQNRGLHIMQDFSKRQRRESSVGDVL